ncbi:MAG: type III restriction-modification system endonuclease [Helicobacteraceae bacterium]|jgi:type III restriction enzyme|nr:type III restriction-modification system endonuclease [Helicobacteraceae bacterium]
MRLEKLEYQLDAINSAIKSIYSENIRENASFNANPILRNTRNIDVKMETGTGKTYVYTRLMHELKQRFDFFKFIIIVPSIAIKEGVKMSIASDEWNRHFKQEFANQTISLSVINAGDFDIKKGKRKQIPEALRRFCDGSKAEGKTINALLLNDAMLSSVSMTRNDYDTNLLGSINRPVDGLKAVRPIVIIDEPHRFKKDGKAWQNIKENISPQLIIRFGATFPYKEISVGKGKQKIIDKTIDYENLVYDLNAVKAFNDGFVKSVHIQYPALKDLNGKKYKVKSVKKGKSAVIGDKEIKVGESLSIVDTAFEGALTLEFDKNYATQLKLSNELAIDIGLELSPQIYSSDYQTLLLTQALEAHFEKERDNFYRKHAGENPPRIKTNTLFFIDSVASFRGDGENRGWLRVKFEELLKIRLQNEIKTASGEYKEFLEASLRDIGATIAGYFADDNAKKNDEIIQKEVDDILRNKEQMLRFKNNDGEWNTRRFLFSKWTLREGWDNPNIFVIAKLRSSGSEISKLQEVGRGLRLPFDENGTRVASQDSAEDFRLTYIIDYSEREFAKKLVGEINADGAKLIEGKINDTILDELVKYGYADDMDAAFINLLSNKIIDRDKNILDIDRFFALLPDDSGIKVKDGKITNQDLPQKENVRLNKSNFSKLKELWDTVKKRYMLRFEKVDNNELENALKTIFAIDDLFVEPSIEIVDTFLYADKDSISLEKGGYSSAKSDLGIIPYGEFLKRLNKQTCLPIPSLHKALIVARVNKKTPNELFNTQTLDNIVKRFETKFAEIFRQKFNYSSLDYSARTSIFAENGEFMDELKQGVIGTKTADRRIVDLDRYLYENIIAYDSDLELEILKVKPPRDIVVYGKLPKKSIMLPTYTGGATSPDFVYAIGNDEKIELHLIIEAKSENPRLLEQVAIDAQEKAFRAIGGNIKWRMETNVASFERELKKLAESL